MAVIVPEITQIYLGQKGTKNRDEYKLEYIDTIDTPLLSKPFFLLRQNTDMVCNVHV